MAQSDSTGRACWRGKTAAVALAVLFLAGPWLLAIASHVPVLESASGSAYRFVYGPLAALFAPWGMHVEDHVLGLASAGMEHQARSEAVAVRDRGVAVLSNVATIAFLIFLGGSVGSFLNVVVYRLPLRLGLLRPGSRCPACGHPIRARDNVPVFGWLLLKGRCRDCQAPIAPRYPIVEGTVAAIFLVLGLVELFTGGRNLPGSIRWANVRGDGLGWFASDLLWVYLYHCCLLCVLLAAGLINQDGYRIPRRLVAFGFLVGLVGPVIAPQLRPAVGVLERASAPLLVALFDGVLGITSGLLLGMAATTVQTACQRSDVRTGRVFGPACTGAYLGWQAALLVTAVAAILETAAALVGRRQQCDARHAAIPAAAFLHILVWNRINGLIWNGGHYATMGTIIGSIAVVVTFAALAGRCRSRSPAAGNQGA